MIGFELGVVTGLVLLAIATAVKIAVEVVRGQ